MLLTFTIQMSKNKDETKVDTSVNSQVRDRRWGGPYLRRFVGKSDTVDVVLVRFDAKRPTPRKTVVNVEAAVVGTAKDLPKRFS